MRAPVYHSKYNPVRYTSDYRPALDPNDASDTRRKGLTFVYDGLLSAPLTAPSTPIRRDAYGRTLPITPSLPCEPADALLRKSHIRDLLDIPVSGSGYITLVTGNKSDVLFVKLSDHFV